MNIEDLTLSVSFLKELPEMTVGERIAAIRQKRGLIKSQLRKMAGIAGSTYVYVEKRDAIPNPKNLFNISKVLRVDPILIIKGKNWNLVSALLEDKEKLFLLRLRKGWTQEELAIALEKAGLNFNTSLPDSKRTRITQWEIGAVKPIHNTVEIIRRVLGDDTIFGGVANPEKPAKPLEKTKVQKSNWEEQETGVTNKTAEKALKRLESLGRPKKRQDSNRPLGREIRLVRLIISDLRFTGATRDAEILQARLNRKLKEIEYRGERLNRSLL